MRKERWRENDAALVVTALGAARLDAKVRERAGPACTHRRPRVRLAEGRPVDDDVVRATRHRERRERGADEDGALQMVLPAHDRELPRSLVTDERGAVD